MNTSSRFLALAVSLILGAGLVPGVSTSAAAPGAPWQPGKEKSVPGTGFTVPPAEPDPAEELALRATPSVSWPAPGSAELTAGAATSVAAGGLPVRLNASRTGGPATATVELAGRYDDGLLLRLRRTDGVKATGPASLQVDYSKFRDAYGGDWAVRLRLVALPECALSTPDKEGCEGTPVPTANNGSGLLTGEVAVGEGSLYAVTAAASSGAGDFQASSLSPSATWSVGGSAGEFAWSYPFDAPPSLEGPEPQLSLGYSSSGVDGRTSATNNQPSWIGEGFEFTPGGYIERRYKSCGVDKGGNNGTRKTGDLCWGTDNATFSLNGRGGELVLDDTTKIWKPKVDDGSTVERLELPADNGDNNREAWKFTARDGTQFFFGLHRLPSTTANPTVTNSVWTVPVFGNHSGEPCHQTAFDTSFCNQAWRWNLDYVVDPHGNTMSLFYNTETNNYGRNLSATKVSTYVRGGWVSRIDYGQRHGQALTTLPVGRVLFTTADRCIPGTTCTTAQPANWPDVPWDQACSSTTNCPNKFTPTFFTQKRLSKITTQVLRGSTLDNVDSWTLNHTFPSPGDGTRAGLWLNSISHTGHVGPTDASLPDVNFDAVQMTNRVDGIGDTVPPMNWMRIRRVRLDSGGQIAITYSTKDCAVPGNLPVPDNNTKRCHPLRWTPDGQTAERKDWFNKYVVTEVTEADATTGLAPEVTQVEYPSTPAWRHDEQDGLVPEERKSWSQWRGYEKVRVRKGIASGKQSLTETLFFRGMDGNKIEAGGTREAWTTDSTGVRLRDSDPLAGTQREKITFTGAGAMQDRSIHDPWLSGATATRVRGWGTTTARHLEEAKVRQSKVTPTGGWQTTGADNEYDTRGILQRSTDFNNVADPNDDTCTRYTYAPNPSLGILEMPARVETVATSCDQAPSYPDDLISDERTYYDNATTVGAPPVKGDITRKEAFNGWVNGVPNYVTTLQAKYDAYGRTTEMINIKGARTTTAYTPATGPVTRTTTTNQLNHTVVTELEPAWGEEIAVTDPNGRKTQKAYDGLGRLTKVWLPGRDSATQTPNAEYSYLVRTSGANVVTSRTLQPDGGYQTEYELFDGQLRPRQTQAPAPGGGRIVTDIVHDSRGLEIKRNGPYFNDAPPGTEILIPNEAALPSQHLTEYDDTERPTLEVFKVLGVEKWRTTHTYAHNTHTVDPPDGQTPTTKITDDEGRLRELRQYVGNSPAGAFDKTTYTYNRKGQLETVTDPMGNVWRNFYDVVGRLKRSEDPDRGAVDFTYNDAGEMTSQKDARGVTLVNEYDILGRKTKVREGSPTGPILSQWAFDTSRDGSPARGQQTSASRFAGANEYKVEVAGYDTGGRPTGSVHTIPASEGRLAGTYAFPTTYHADGDVATLGQPAIAGLPAETLTLGYNVFGLPSTLRGATQYVADTQYSPFGELAGVTLSAGGKWVNLGYEYETGTRRLSKAVVQRENAPQKLADFGYTYDQAGNIVKVTDSPDPGAGSAAETQCFRYDYLRRLTTAWTPGSADCAPNPTAGGLGGPAPYWHSWTFDKVGNRKSETRVEPSGATTTSTYNYPAAGAPQPHTLRSVTTTGPSGTRTDNFGYDPSGNTTNRPAGTLTWDAEGHLATVTDAGKTTNFVYDANGNRLLRRDPNGTTLYLGGTEVALSATGVLTGTRYYTHAGRTVAVRTSADNKLTWLAADHHGTPEIAIDSTTQQVTRRRFTPYGEARGASVAWPGQKSFVGGTSDPSTGLVHLGAREYDPKLGRFLSVDPVIDYEDPQQTNGYSYANNNPITYTDPDGKLGFITSIVKTFKTVVMPVIKKVVQPVITMVPFSVPFWANILIRGLPTLIKKWDTAYKTVVKPVVKSVTTYVNKQIEQQKTIRKKIHDDVKKAWKDTGKSLKALGTAVKNNKHVKAAGKAWDWTKKNVLESKYWKGAKVGLGVAAVFGCAVCGAVAAGMGAVDLIAAATDGDGDRFAEEAIGLVSFGIGSKVSAGAKVWKAYRGGTLKTYRANPSAANRKALLDANKDLLRANTFDHAAKTVDAGLTWKSGQDYEDKYSANQGRYLI